MADIELVIKIDEGIAQGINDGENDAPRNIVRSFQATIADAIKGGTPLPKGHGDLKDELDLDLFAPSLGTGEYVNDLMAKHDIDYANGDDEDKVRAFASDLIHSFMNVVDTAPTIIEGSDSE